MNQNSNRTRHFNEKKAVPPSDCPFLNCIDDALSVFGDNVKQSIYYYLETDNDLPKEMLPIKAKLFEDTMQAMFKDGAKVILRLVVKNSYIKAGLEPPPETYKLSSLRKISGKFREACSLKRKKCHVKKCVYFDEEEKIE